MGQTTRQRLLEYAAHRLGQDQLAARLKIPEGMLKSWIDGHVEVPNRKLLALADLIDELDKEKK